MRENSFKEVKDNVNIVDVIREFGIDLNSQHKALCPFHKEDTPSFSVNEKEQYFKCFGCGASGDVIDFVSKIKGIEQIEAMNWLAEKYSINIENNTQITRKTKPSTDKGQALKLGRQRIKAYLAECIKSVNKTEYFALRGLTSKTVKRYKLGFDEARNVITMPYNSKLDYYQSRGVKDKKFFKPKKEEVGTEPLYLESSFWSSKGKPIFVVESPICALSICQCGYFAIALCGVGGVNKLVNLVSKKKPSGTLILTLDNDKPGKNAQNDLAMKLNEKQVKLLRANVSGDCKDPNELLMKDGYKLKANLEVATKNAKLKYRTAKNAIAASEICAMDIREPDFIVKNMLPEGLAIVAAASKVGKSWLMMQLCYSIAKGKNFLGQDTIPCDCLYFALEDSINRIKKRTLKMLGDEKVPNNVYYITEAGNANDGLFAQISEELEEHPKIKLVVIDTLQKVRGKSDKGESMYSNDYNEMGKFKKFADKNHICLLLVHHVRKMRDDSDAFNAISGTNGIMGACDTIWVINKKKRTDVDSVLSLTGRDIWGQSVSISRNDNTGIWILNGTAEEVEIRKKRQEYLESPVIITIKKMVEKFPMGWKVTSDELKRVVFDVANVTLTETATKIGKFINFHESDLYYDGVIHKTKRTSSARYHIFTKKSPYIPYAQGYVGLESDVKK